MPLPAVREILNPRPPRSELYTLLGDQVLPEFVPLPSGKTTEFYSGLKRGALNQLILPGPANNYRPPVKSVSLRRAGNLKGKRLVVLASLLEYLRNLQTEQLSASEQASAVI